MQNRTLFYPLLLISPWLMAEQTVLLKMEGLEKGSEAYNNVRVYLSQLSNDEADGSERYQQRVTERVDKALRALGYYQTTYAFSLSPRPRPQKDLLHLRITLDKPVRIDETDIQIAGDLADDEELFKLRVSAVPKQGEVLNHETYDDFKRGVEKIAHAKGYFDGEWRYQRLEVYPRDYLADWRLAYQSGTRYRYGNVRFTNSQIREDYLRNMLRIREGEPYRLNDLSRLSSDYSATKWFSSVLIEPTVQTASKTVDIDLLLQPKKRNEVEIAVGYATDVGPRLQLGWTKPWMNARGHSLETKTYLSRPEQRVEFGYNMPVKAHPLHYYYQLSGGVEHENQNDTRTTGANLGVQRFWNSESDWAFSLGFKARFDAFAQGSEQKFSTLLLYPTASLNRTRTDGNRFPLWGDSQKVTLNWGSKLWASDAGFYSVKASTAWIRSVALDHRVYWRAELGYLHTSRFHLIPPSLRYFAGGDLSIRGFSYKRISPRDQEGKITGATHLATTTLEYQYQLYPNWWGALFYDTGLAAHRFQGRELHAGAGAGVRWASPIGTIKFDVATPVRSPSSEKGVSFYLGIGSEL